MLPDATDPGPELVMEGWYTGVPQPLLEVVEKGDAEKEPLFVTGALLKAILALDARPGGALRPGGGPFADVKPAPALAIIPFMFPMELALFWPGAWPDLTPKGFFEKLRRMPPLTLL